MARVGHRFIGIHNKFSAYQPQENKGKAVPIHAMKAYRGGGGCGGIAPLMLNISTRLM